MNVDDIIKAIADQNAILGTWKENRVEMSNRLRQLEQDISYGEKRRSELLAQLKAILAEDNSKSTERIIEPQTDDRCRRLIAPILSCGGACESLVCAGQKMSSELWKSP